MSLEVSARQPRAFAHSLNSPGTARVPGGTSGCWDAGARASWAQGGGSGNAAVMLLQGTRDEDRRSVPKDAKKQKAGNPQLGEEQDGRNGCRCYCGSIILPSH